jgi:flagellar basal-body rod protein FlgB
MNPLESPNSRLLLSLLDATAQRARVIAGNVANQNTPGYRRQVLDFEERLREALARGRGPDELARLEPVVREDALTPARADGNNVNLELEMSAMRQNRLMYEMFSTLHASRANLITAALESR